MKSLVESINESMRKINERYSPKDEKLFWKWIEELGGTEMMSKIQKEESGKPLYIKASELGTTGEQFELFCDIFFEIADDFLTIIEDDDPGMSDDSCQYASWSAPFYGEKTVKKQLKSKDWSICEESFGEWCGYAMSYDNYWEYLEDNGLEPEGFK